MACSSIGIFLFFSESLAVSSFRFFFKKKIVPEVYVKLVCVCVCVSVSLAVFIYRHVCVHFLMPFPPLLIPSCHHISCRFSLSLSLFGLFLERQVNT